MPDDAPPPNAIGTLNEHPLHAALKDWLAQPGDRFEVPLDGAVIDIVRGDPPDALLIEIQTRHVGAIRRKLARLAAQHRVQLVIPIAREKWIVRRDAAGAVIGRRKSPKRGAVIDLFAELVRAPGLVALPGLSLLVLLTQEEEWRHYEPGRSWRRKGWVIDERRLLAVVEQHTFAAPADLLALLPEAVPPRFTTADIAGATGRPRRLAQQMAYTLREAGLIAPVGRQGRAVLYERGGENSG